ncbi:hypothetical protein [Mycolicibacterium celeriflavum]
MADKKPGRSPKKMPERSIKERRAQKRLREAEAGVLVRKRKGY